MLFRQHMTDAFLTLFRAAVSGFGFSVVGIALRDLWIGTPVSVEMALRYLMYFFTLFVLWMFAFIMETLEGIPVAERKTQKGNTP